MTKTTNLLRVRTQKTTRSCEGFPSDEMLTCAALVIGSAPLESDMARSNSSVDSSVLSSVPTIASLSVPAVLGSRVDPTP